jgi:pimeloyl-ACP methyl ester carboxylesterase
MDRTEHAPEAVAQSVLDDLHNRLSAYRRVALPQGFGWERGVDGDYLADLIDYWLHSYDWRVHEEQIRSWPWAFVGAGSDTPIRAIHQRAPDEQSTAVVLLHGWPDSVLRFQKVLPALADLHVVAPALPGYPFAAPAARRGLNAAATADAIAAAMTELGYDRYVVSAGDVGCDVAECLADRHRAHVAALHLTDVSQYRYLVDPPTDVTERERAYMDHGHRWQEAEGGYMHLQRTKPHTVAVALNDSPAGLAAWILEKLRSWTDCGGDVESVFTRDEMLTWITAYWVSDAIGTSFTPYVEGGLNPEDRIDIPTAFTIFPKDLVNAPREFAARFFDVRSWTELTSGGHFAAWECPADYADGIRSAVGLSLT